MATPAPLPVDELRDLGVKLQQSIVLTRMRANQLKLSRTRARALRVVDSADKLFGHLSQVSMAAQGLTGFLQKAMGVSVDELFNATGSPRAARGVAFAGVAAANDAVKRQLDELAAVNVAIDKEVKNGTQTEHD